MTERAQQLREVARQALYRTPNDQECEVPIAVAVIREIANCFEYDSYGLASLNADDFNQIANELEAL